MDNLSRDGNSAELISPSLLGMQSRGFEVDGLLHTQRAAFRMAAQLTQHKLASSEVVTVQQFKDMVEQCLAGKHPILNAGDVTPGHIASYMQSKMLLQTSTPKHLLEEAWTLKNTPLPADIYGEEPQKIITKWLAHDLVDLRFYAATLENLTPSFARVIRENSSKIESTFADVKGLRASIQSIFLGMQEDDEHDQDDDSPSMAPS